MALHLSACQYNREFSPRRLGNWEVPRQYKLERPKEHTGLTRIIANDRGHLLPGEPRPKESPWGHYIPTWRMPKRITKQIAKELQAPKILSKKATKAEYKSEPAKPTLENDPELKKYFTDNDEENPCTNLPKVEPEKEPVKDLSYVPGDLSKEKHRPASYDLLRPKKTLTLEAIQEFDMADKAKSNKKEQMPKINPFACVYRNFEMAKKCAKENLEHQPLPDTVTDAMYKKFQIQRNRDPGLALKNIPEATAVGWKGYGVVGPTQCTKMRVYRPKTCATKDLKNVDDNPRPGICGSFDLKWRFIKRKHVSPIELAICWDMIPENLSDEPKRSIHIDGSNGSAAPAVFTLVHSPKPIADEISSRKSSASYKTEHHLETSQRPFTTREYSRKNDECDGIHGCNTIKSDSYGSSSTKKLSSFASNQDDGFTYKNIDPNNNLGQFSGSINNLNNLENSQKLQQINEMSNKLYKSSPNLPTLNDKEIKEKNFRKQQYCRPCVACNHKCVDDQNRTKSEYKQAFKAGKLAAKNLDGTIKNDNGIKYLKIPKQKDPYAKRNYDINSLHPPFSIWKGTSCQSYPEHWRLASIYRHSYKPVENRKRPLLASVYQ